MYVSITSLNWINWLSWQSSFFVKAPLGGDKAGKTQSILMQSVVSDHLHWEHLVLHNLLALCPGLFPIFVSPNSEMAISWSFDPLDWSSCFFSLLFCILSIFLLYALRGFFFHLWLSSELFIYYLQSFWG